MGMALPHSERGLDRLVNFTDAAVAISITLLVLPLVDIGAEVSTHPLQEVLGAHWENLLAFGISFAVIGNLWMIHHRLFELVSDYDTNLIRLNLFWMATITALPFTTNVVANVSSNGAVYALYLGNIALASLCTLGIRFYLSKHTTLLRPEGASELHVLGSVIPTAILLIALVLAVLVPSVGALWLVLMFAGTPLERLIIRREAKTSG
jgi:uncharacterized membrane protein